MKDTCKYKWLCLTLAILNIIIYVIILAEYFNCHFFKETFFWTAIGSIATTASVIIAVITYCQQVKINSKQKSYEYFSRLKNEVFDIEREIGQMDNKRIKELIDYRTYNFKKNQKFEDDWEKITKYLTRLEHFATCVNDEIFNIETVKRMSGDYLKKQYSKLKDIIDHKRASNNGLDTYYELEKMISKF